MRRIATITNKRQLTIPVSLFQALGLKEGEKVVIKKKRGAIMIQSARSLVEELAGSVKLPQRFKGMSIEKIIKLAKEEYFQKRK